VPLGDLLPRAVSINRVRRARDRDNGRSSCRCDNGLLYETIRLHADGGFILHLIQQSFGIGCILIRLELVTQALNSDSYELSGHVQIEPGCQMRHVH
jgi:hypothetical protein